MTKEIQYSVEETEAVIGHDPEYADAGNPRGNIYGMLYSAVVYLPDGSVRSYEWSDDFERAVGDCMWLEQYRLIPENHYRWMYGTPENLAEQREFEERARFDEENGLDF